jgi:hypothetical protein
MTIDFAKLREPFAPSDVSWRIGQAGKKGNGEIWAKVLAYIDNRCVQDRLDTVCGPDHWRNEEPRKGPDGGVLQGISIEVAPDKWITKWDGAENSDIEAVKGGLSDAMKRASVLWGIGRYLYELGESWAEIVAQGTQGAHYANCKIKVQGKEEYASFHWVPPRNVLVGQNAPPVAKVEPPPPPKKAEPPKKSAPSDFDSTKFVAALEAAVTTAAIKKIVESLDKKPMPIPDKKVPYREAFLRLLQLDSPDLAWAETKLTALRQTTCLDDVTFTELINKVEARQQPA